MTACIDKQPQYLGPHTHHTTSWGLWRVVMRRGQQQEQQQQRRKCYTGGRGTLLSPVQTPTEMCKALAGV